MNVKRNLTPAIERRRDMSFHHVWNGWLYKKIEAAERLDEITPFSAGQLQRKLRIGYGQAAGIVNLFEELEIVSAIQDPSGNRVPLVSPRQAAIKVIQYFYEDLLAAEIEDNQKETLADDSFEFLLEEDTESSSFLEPLIIEETENIHPLPPPKRIRLPHNPTRKDLLRGAAEAACDRGRIGTSALQRALGLGYGRAASLIDTLEELGIVGPDPGNKRGREVLLPLEEALKRVDALPSDED